MENLYSHSVSQEGKSPLIDDGGLNGTTKKGEEILERSKHAKCQNMLQHFFIYQCLECVGKSRHFACRKTNGRG